MIKAFTIEMIEKLAVTDGTVSAGANGTKNYFLGTVANGVATAAGANGAGLKLFANYGNGDDMGTEFTVPSGEKMTAWDIKAWAGKQLEVSPESITYASGATYANIAEGTTKMKAGADGNLAIVASASAGDLYFVVNKKINFGGNGVLVTVTQA